MVLVLKAQALPISELNGGRELSRKLGASVSCSLVWELRQDGGGVFAVAIRPAGACCGKNCAGGLARAVQGALRNCACSRKDLRRIGSKKQDALPQRTFEYRQVEQ